MSDKPDVFEGEDPDNIYILDDDDGNSCRFLFLDLIDYNEREYVVLLSEEEAAKEESDVDILEVVPDENNAELENYLPVEDDDVIEAVFNIFAKNNKDSLDFC
ncbi:MAG: DUF1292 domain-containing protein [Lachnospiraceae bacterium]